MISVFILGVEKILTWDEYESVLEGDEDLYIMIVKLGELKEDVYEDLFLSINTSFSVGKVSFSLLKNIKSEYFRDGNWKLAWDWLVS